MDDTAAKESAQEDAEGISQEQVQPEVDEFEEEIQTPEEKVYPILKF